jgi:hypothetical protein
MNATPAKKLKLKAVQRGKFRQLVDAQTGETPQVKLYRARVTKTVAADKPYITLDLGMLEDQRSDAAGLADVDAFIHKLAEPRFSPLSAKTVIVKMPPKDVRWENENGDPALPWPVELHAVVDVILKPGAFGEFGYCWLVHRIKPHSERV